MAEKPTPDVDKVLNQLAEIVRSASPSEKTPQTASPAVEKPNEPVANPTSEPQPPAQIDLEQFIEASVRGVARALEAREMGEGESTGRSVGGEERFVRQSIRLPGEIIFGIIWSPPPLDTEVG